MEGGGELTLEKTRIYVGGLGGGVTEDDLRRTFSALGQVVDVDVVRTKDRSFAYLDFLPSSDKSLPKLFSTYNGCMWKGGKLRLEKAKEHYLLRLKREWQEESENASKASDSSNADAPENHDTLENPKKASPTDKTQIQIFFPKLGKVKSLGQVGIGKHKYSFQRIQVPSIPTHFCDCEEHSLAFPPQNKKQSIEFDNSSYEVNEKEIDIMNSVMNKIFEKSNPSKKVNGRNDESVGVENDEEDNLTDEDNLIINVASGKNDSMEMRNMMAKQEPVARRLNTSTEKLKSQNKSTPLTKKRKSPHSEENHSSHTPIPETSRNSQTRSNSQENRKTKVESGNNSLRSLKSNWKDLIGQKRKTSFNIANFIATLPKKEEFNGDNNEPTKITIPDILSNYRQQNEEEEQKDDNLETPLTTINQDFDQKEEEPQNDNQDFDQNEEEPQTDNQDFKKPTVKNDQDLTKSARGEFWRHKSSWTQLISTTNHTSFSISQIVPDLSFEKSQRQVDTVDLKPANENLDDRKLVEKVVNLSPVKKKSLEKRRILSLGNLESEGTCSFMRTEDSMKEWKKAKTSHSVSLNKKKKQANETA